MSGQVRFGRTRRNVRMPVELRDRWMAVAEACGLEGLAWLRRACKSADGAGWDVVLRDYGQVTTRGGSVPVSVPLDWFAERSGKEIVAAVARGLALIEETGVLRDRFRPDPVEGYYVLASECGGEWLGPGDGPVDALESALEILGEVEGWLRGVGHEVQADRLADAGAMLGMWVKGEG